MAELVKNKVEKDMLLSAWKPVSGSAFISAYMDLWQVLDQRLGMNQLREHIDGALEDEVKRRGPPRKGGNWGGPGT